MSTGDPQHPDPQCLQAFSQGRVAVAELADLQSHLDSCPTCCEVLATLVDDDPFIQRLRRFQQRAGSNGSCGVWPYADSSVPVRVRGDAAPDGSRPQPGLPTVPGYEILGKLGRGV